jgi:hypothetical protein
MLNGAWRGGKQTAEIGFPNCLEVSMLSAAWRLSVSTENWHEERERLALKLERMEAGKSAQVDEDRSGALRYETTDQIIDRVKARLAELNTRLGARNA